MPLEINSEFIEDALIEEEYQHILGQYTSRKLKNPSIQIPERDELLTLVKENISRRYVILQEASRRGIEVSKSDKEELMGQLIGQSKDLSSLSESQWRELADYAEKRLKTDILFREVSQDIDPIEERHVRVFYADNKEQYRKGQRIHFLYFALKKPHSASPLGLSVDALLSDVSKLPEEQREQAFKARIVADAQAQKEAYRKAAELQASGELKDADAERKQAEKVLFAEYKNSEKKDIQSVFRDALFQAETLMPFHFSHDSYNYVFMLVKRFPPGIPSFEEIHEILYQDLLTEVRERKIDAFTASLMQKSKILDHRTL